MEFVGTYPLFSFLYPFAAVTVMTLIGFVLAVVATVQDGEDVHFTQYTHQQVGLSVVIIVLIQSVAGFFRPPLPVSKQLETHDKGDEANDDMKGNGISDASEATNSSIVSEKSDDSDSTGSISEKTIKRMAWEILHRTMGACLVGAAWYNCHSGYELIASAFGTQENHSSMFWGFAGGIGGLIFLMAYVIRI